MSEKILYVTVSSHSSYSYMGPVSPVSDAVVRKDANASLRTPASSRAHARSTASRGSKRLTRPRKGHSYL